MKSKTMEMRNNLKLDIGSGGKSLLGDDWVSVDSYVIEADYQWDMDKLNLKDETTNEIYSCHALEHISRHEVIPTLKEWYRVLKKGGKVTILVPNLENALDYMKQACRAENNLDLFEWRCHFLFGKQDHPGNYHKTGFTPWLLDYYMTQAGFSIESREFVYIYDIKTLKWIGVK